MPSPDFVTVIAEVAVTAEQVATGTVPEQAPKLGARLRGTSTFQAPPGSVPGLVALIALDASRTDWYVAEVLAGGSLLAPLLKFDEGTWSPPGNLQMLGRRVVLPVRNRLSADGDVTAFIAFAAAMSANLEQIALIRKRALSEKAVFKPCLEIYDAWVQDNPGESRLARLTDHLLGASDITRRVIQDRSATRHQGAEAEQIIRSVVNSLRRSAGTNYQGLVALAIAEELVARESVWYVHYPPPKDYMRAMALRFSGNNGLDVDIDPDIDILIKNAAWKDNGGDEPVVMLSVKTSLADRAGAAARWKMYFDVATRTCPFEGHLEGCAWHDQGLRFAKPDVRVRLQHCIVTANIYKVGSDAKYAEEGELGSAQTKANTFMFDRRYATRVGEGVEMEGWEPLTALVDLLGSMSDEQKLPH